MYFTLLRSRFASPDDRIRLILNNDRIIISVVEQLSNVPLSTDFNITI